MWEETGYWFSPDCGYFKEEEGKFIFPDGNVLPNNSAIRMMPVPKKQYEQGVVIEPNG